MPLPDSMFDDTSVLSRVTYVPSTGLLAVTRAGDEIAFDVPVPYQEQLGRRLVVYLDQNQWSALDNARHAGSDDEDRHAARQLEQWVWAASSYRSSTTTTGGGCAGLEEQVVMRGG
jgi:hypothetical protein